MKIKTFLPVFPGFRGTIFEEFIKDSEEVGKNACKSVEFKLVSLKIAKSIKFERLNKYANDSIDIEIDLRENNMLNYLRDNKKEFRIYLKMSKLYSPDYLKSWINKKILNNKHQVKTILDFILLNEDFDEYTLFNLCIISKYFTIY